MIRQQLATIGVEQKDDNEGQEDDDLLINILGKQSEWYRFTSRSFPFANLKNIILLIFLSMITTSPIKNQPRIYVPAHRSRCARNVFENASEDVQAYFVVTQSRVLNQKFR